MYEWNKSPEIKEISSLRITFRSNYGWAYCLSASQERNQFYFLVNNEINQQKIRQIVPDVKFECIDVNEKELNDLELRNYQKEDVEFLSRLENGAIFSEMRTGKTPVALYTWQKWKTQNLLVIVPSILQYHWQKSLVDWLKLPAYIITYLDQDTRFLFYHKLLQRWKDNWNWIVIISKDTFKYDDAYFSEMKQKRVENCCVIVDEAHFLRNYRSQQSQSIYNLQGFAHKLIITGTPIVNHYSDVFGLLKFLQPSVYSSYWKFCSEYFDIYEWKIKRGKKTFVLRQARGFKSIKQRLQLRRLICKISVQRKQREVLLWLSKIIYHCEYLLMEEKQQNLYLELSNKWSEHPPLEVLTQLKTVTLNPMFFGLDCYGAKMNFLINYLNEKKEQAIIVFSTRSETFLIPLYKLLKECTKVGLIIGQTTQNERQRNIDWFQCGTFNVLLCNIQAAGVGLNLSRADTIVFADRSYSPADNSQAESRFLPTSSQSVKKVRLVIDLICRGSIDEKIHKLLKRKESIVKLLKQNPRSFFE